MTKSVFAALFFILALSGCANITKIEKEQSAGEYYKSINEKCKDRYALLTLEDKGPLRVYNLNIGIDTTFWTDITLKESKSVLTGKVYSVQVTDRIGGLKHGLLYGAAGGALTVIWWALLIDNAQIKYNGPAVPFLTLGAAALGGLFGAMGGVITGEPYYFIINEKEQKLK